MSEREYRAELARFLAAQERRSRQSFGDRYTHFNRGNLLAIHERERVILPWLRRAGRFLLAGQRILDLGCGDGFWLRSLIHWGAQPDHLWGLDLQRERVARARELCAPGTHVLVADAGRAPFANESFDLALQSTVFTSILDAGMRRCVATELLRVLRPGGLIVWYDFRYDNPRNADVRGIGRREIRRLFPGCRIDFRSVTLAPFLARRLARVSRWAVELLNLLPALRTHLLAFIVKVHGA